MGLKGGENVLENVESLSIQLLLLDGLMEHQNSPADHETVSSAKIVFM